MSARAASLLLWLLAGGLAAAIVFWQLTHPPRPPSTAAATKRPPDLPAVAPTARFRLSPPDQYGEVIARPLFVAARRPEPPPPPEEAPPEKPVVKAEQKLTLLGVVIAPNIKVALLRPEEANAKTVQIRLGETVGEWQLEAIYPNRVVVRKGESTQELVLVRPKQPAAPRAGRAGAKPPTQGAGAIPPPPAGTPPVSQPDALPPAMVVPPPPQQDDG